MSEDADQQQAPMKTSVRRHLPLAVVFRFLGRIIGLSTRVASILVCGCLLLVSLFSLQVAGLELSDRLDLFPLYGFYFVNLSCGLFLSWFIVRPRKHTFVRNQNVARVASVPFSWFARFLVKAKCALHTQETKRVTQTKIKPIAVLLIIKRQASVDSEQKIHAASA